MEQVDQYRFRFEYVMVPSVPSGQMVRQTRVTVSRIGYDAVGTHEWLVLLKGQARQHVSDRDVKSKARIAALTNAFKSDESTGLVKRERGDVWKAYFASLNRVGKESPWHGVEKFPIRVTDENGRGFDLSGLLEAVTIITYPDGHEEENPLDILDSQLGLVQVKILPGQEHCEYSVQVRMKTHADRCWYG